MLMNLKKTMLETKRLPLGILIKTENIYNCDQNESVTYLENYGTKRKLQYWNNYAQEQFDGIFSNLTLYFSSATATIEAPV